MTDVPAPATGWAIFEGGAIRDALEIWAELACRPHEGDALPPPAPPGPEFGQDEVLAWAEAVLDAARAAEGSMAPRASVITEDDGVLLALLWEGTFTPGREVVVELFGDDPEDPGRITSARLRWCSGTGHPSTFLGGVFGGAVPSSASDWGYLRA
jgi:hypothetical protein